jgi:hypothetical protein
MKRLWVIFGAVGLLIVAGIGLWMGIGSSYATPESSRPKASAPSAGVTDAPIVNPAELGQQADNQEASMRRQQQQESVVQLVQDFQQHPGNITQFLAALKQACRSIDNDADAGFSADCQALLQQVLSSYPDRQFVAMLQRLLDRLPAYEQAMQSKVMSTATAPRQRYEAIWSLREQLLGKQEAVLAFGEEHDLASYQFAYGDLLNRAAGMTSQQRQAEFNRLQQQNQAVISSIDGQAGSYEKALQLALIGVTDGAQQQQITRQLRQQYFSATEIAQMIQRDQQLATQQEQVTNYQAEVTALKQDMEKRRDRLGESAWQQEYQMRLEQLRHKNFP